MSTFTNDFFAGTAFEGANVSKLIMRSPHNPRLCSEESWFVEEGINGVRVNVQGLNGVLADIPVTERSTPETQSSNAKRDIRNFECPRISEKKQITKSDILNILTLEGTSETTKTILVNQRLAAIRENLESMIEKSRIAATSGTCVYNVGDTRVGTMNMIAAFGAGATAIRQEEDLNLGNATEDMLTHFMNILDMVHAAMGDVTPREIIGLCSPLRWDTLMTHAGFKTYYTNNQMLVTTEAINFQNTRYPELRIQPNFRLIRYPGVGIEAGDINFFPSEGSMHTFWGEDDYIDSGTPVGQRIVADMEQVNRFGWEVFGTTNGLHMPLRPWSCVRGFSSTEA